MNGQDDKRPFDFYYLSVSGAGPGDVLCSKLVKSSMDII